MKNIFLSSLTLLICLLVQSCSKDSSDKQPSGNSEAIASNDTNSFGVYKGVIIGSSGIIKLEINNGDNLVRAYITIDGSTKDTLTSTYPFTSGQAITKAAFKGRISTMTFSVNANGTNPHLVSITIQGHSNVTGVLVKETSTQIAKCYEGSYKGKTSTGNEVSGTFNCVVLANSIIGISREGQSGYTDVINGTSINGSISAKGTVSTGAIFKGSFSSNQCSGTWVNSEYSGNWSGKRTL